MKKWLLHIFLVSVLGMLTASCSQDVDELAPDTTGSGTVKIQFSLAMGESQSGSRADWGSTTNGTLDNPAGDDGDRVVGDNYENMIDLSKLQVFLFQGTTYLGEVGGLTLTPNNSSITYTFTGEVTVTGATVSTNASGQKSLSNATIMVTANYDGYVNGNVAVTYNYLFDYIAEAYKADAAASVKRYIPMWGMLKPENGIPLNESADDDTFTPIGDIYMLRSMAKIEVVLDGNIDSDYKITGATLNKYNQRGYLLPAKYPASTDGVAASYFNATSTSFFDTESCINADNSSTVAPTNGLAFNVGNGGKSCVIYVPEYSVSTEDLSINLQISKGTTSITDKLKDGGTFPLHQIKLVRNHWYQCTVKSISDGMEVMLAVAPWTENKDILDYTKHTANYSVSSINEITLGWINDTFTKKENNEITLDLNKTATFKVNIGTPINAEWRVTLDDPQNMFEFNTNEREGFSGTQQEDSKTIYGFNDLDGEVVTIGIKSKSPDTTGVYSAILRMYINLGTKWIQLDLVDGDITNGISVYTIKHVKSGL